MLNEYVPNKSVRIVISALVGLIAAALFYSADSVSIPIIFAWIPMLLGWEIGAICLGAASFWTTNILLKQKRFNSRTFLNEPEKIVPLFSKESRTLLMCPSCGEAVDISQPKLWDGKKHLRCGQHIKVDESRYELSSSD